MALPQFPNEAAFRDQWIKPFLSRLGYILVTHHHGTNEHGKDFYFADFDRFEHPRYYAAQVKLGNIGTGQAETGELLDQVKACFDVRIRDRKGGDEQRICAVYVMASGSISDQARTRIAGFCRSERFGENVYFLDGDRLETLERSSTFRIDNEARGLLMALQNELTSNIRRLDDIDAQLRRGENRILSKCRVSALEALMTAPIAENVIANDVIEPIWILMDSFNNLIEISYLSRGLTQAELGFLEGFTPSVRGRCQGALTAVQAAIRQLDERRSLTIDVSS
jgi:hypothetical protein